MGEHNAKDLGSETSMADKVEVAFQEMIEGIVEIDVNNLRLIGNTISGYQGEKELDVWETGMQGALSVYEAVGERSVEGAECRNIVNALISKMADRFFEGNKEGELNQEDLYRMISIILKYKRHSMYKKAGSRGGNANRSLWAMIDADLLYQNKGERAFQIVEEQIGFTAEVDRDMMNILEKTNPEDFRLFIGDFYNSSHRYSQKVRESMMKGLPSLNNFYVKNEEFASNFGLILLKKAVEEKYLYPEEIIFLENFVDMFGRYVETNPKVWDSVVEAFKEAGFLQYALDKNALWSKNAEKKIPERLD